MSPQQTIGHYRILTKLGAGGMGEVWRATDTKLCRDVAIKFLPDAFAADADRMARFEREAQVLASLNHPNIAQIYGAEDRVLIMELVEGETLKGPLDMETALNYARQIAAALEAAHEKGIVHRDLKPGNVMVTPAGVVKVLDFGLARITQESDSRNASLSPTLTISPSRTGVILGTAAYMAPEQARGKAVDKRADIWAFGCVLYQMLVGDPPFSGETTSDILAAVIKEEPDLSAIPPRIQPVLAKCLRKDPNLRWRDIGDVRMSLDESADVPLSALVKRQSATLPWALLAVVSLVAIVLAFSLSRRSGAAPKSLVSLSVDLGPDAVVGRDTTVVLSTDGTRMVFPVRTQGEMQALAIRFLNQASATLLPGTENAVNPFFSPDGEWVGFFGGGRLKKVSIHGGAAVTLCDAPAGRGGSWGDDGFIVAALNVAAGLSRVPGQGGPPQPLTKPAAPGETHRWPQLLPRSEVVLFTASPNRTNFTNAAIEAASLKTGQRKIVQRDAFFGRYLSSGHLAFLRGETLYAAPFDAERLEVTGSPVPVIEGMAGSTYGGGQFSFAQDGTFAYLPGTLSGNLWQIVWFDTAGKIAPLLPTPGTYFHLHFSPDGKRLAWASGRGKPDIWIYDLERETQTRLTFTEEDTGPLAWTPDGKHLVFISGPPDAHRVMWIRADGAGEPQVLMNASSNLPCCFSANGKYLVLNAPVKAGWDMITVPFDIVDPDHPKAGEPAILLHTPARAVADGISPDGRWIAYTSSESGIPEVYVRPFAGTSVSQGKWQISSGGGSFPEWSRSGRQIIFSKPGGGSADTQDFHIWMVDYEAEGTSFRAGKPRLWSDKPAPTATTATQAFDLAPDGKRMAVLALPQAQSSKANLHAMFLLNFSDELRRRVQSGK